MIYTFYSYKGGVGRSMALANVAQWLSLQGVNVLMVDWDLEAPGIEEFFFDQAEDLERIRAHPGVIDLLLAYRRSYPSVRPQLPSAAGTERAAADVADVRTGSRADQAAVRQRRATVLKTLLPAIDDAIISVRDPSTTSGFLKLLPAGWRAGDHFQDYATAVQSFDWAEFYAVYDGEAYFDCMRDSLDAAADVVLVDSRTGVTEMSGICTRHLADVVVCLCAPNRQNLGGLLRMIRSFQRAELIAARGRRIEVVAVPTRIENSEVSLLNQFAAEFNSCLEQFAPEAFRQARRTFWNLRIPYVPRYAYSETLAVGASDASSDLEDAYKTLAAHLLLLASPGLVDRGGPTLAAEVNALLPPEHQRAARKVFLSYAASDGQSLARSLIDRLEREAVDVVLFGDASRLPAGSEWANYLDTALAQAHVLLSIITPAATRSPRVMHEIRLARAKGLPVVPVLGPRDATFDTELPPWLRTYHLFDPVQEWDAIVRALRSLERPPKVPFMAPSLPNPVAPRAELVERLVSLLMNTVADPGSGPVIALVGSAGTGKTTLAAALCHDPRVVEEFYDGIMWTTLGPSPDVVRGLAELYAGLTGDRPVFVGIDDATAAFQEKLGTRRCVIVVDDVWNEAHLQPFLRAGPRCVRILTTRNHSIAQTARHSVAIGELASPEAAALLASYLDTPNAITDMVMGLADRLGRLPLLLALTGTTLRDRVRRGDSIERSLEYAYRALDRRGITAFDRRDPAERSQALAHSLGLTLDQLTTEERTHFSVLGAFPRDQGIPLSAAQKLWGLDDFDAEEFAHRLAAVSLVNFDSARRTIQIHPLLREFVRESLKNSEELDKRASDLLSGK